MNLHKQDKGSGRLRQGVVGVAAPAGSGRQMDVTGEETSWQNSFAAKEAHMFERAQRTGRPVRIGIYGVTGSGKTWSALSLAKGLVEHVTDSRTGRVAMVDSEAGRAALYADHFAFDMHVLNPPYCPTAFAAALREAQKQGYAAVILDGISAAWSGPGGVMEQVDEARSRGSRAPWQQAGQAHEELLQSIVNAKCHVVVTMRARSMWEKVTQRTREGGNVQHKTREGLRPDQRSDIGYIFDFFWMLSLQEHLATALKDSSGQFQGTQLKLAAETGRLLQLWSSGAQQNPSGLERALHAIRSCSNVTELAALWGDWPEPWRSHPWQEVCSKAVAQRLRELQAA